MGREADLMAGISDPTPLRNTVVYRQDDAPQDERAGVVWLDTSATPPTTKIQDGEGNWGPIVRDDVAFKDAAETFSESDVSVSPGEWVDDGSLGMALTDMTVTDSISAAYDGAGGDNSKTYQMHLTGRDTLTLTTVSGSGTRAVSVLAGGASASTGIGSGDLPNATADISGVSGPQTVTVAIYDKDGYDNTLAQQDYEVSATGDPLTRTAYVTWPAPPDIYAWDRALFQLVEDGGSIDVYVEANDGSGWTEVAGPITRGDTIDADPDENVRYRVEFSRPDANSNPTLEAIYRLEWSKP